MAVLHIIALVSICVSVCADLTVVVPALVSVNTNTTIQVQLLPTPIYNDQVVNVAVSDSSMASLSTDQIVIPVGSSIGFVFLFSGTSPGKFQIQSTTVLENATTITSVINNVEIYDDVNVLFSPKRASDAALAVSIAVAAGAIIGLLSSIFISVYRKKVPRSSGGALMIANHIQFVAIVASASSDIRAQLVDFGKGIRWTAYHVPLPGISQPATNLTIDACAPGSTVFNWYIGTLIVMVLAYVAVGIAGLIFKLIVRKRPFFVSKGMVIVTVSQFWGLSAIAGSASSLGSCIGWKVAGIALLALEIFLIIAAAGWISASLKGSVPDVKYVKQNGVMKWAPLIRSRNRNLPPPDEFVIFFHSIVGHYRGPMWWHAPLYNLEKVVVGILLGNLSTVAWTWSIMGIVGVESLVCIITRPFKHWIRNVFESLAALSRLAMMIGLVYGQQTSNNLTGATVAFIAALCGVGITILYVGVAIREIVVARGHNVITNKPKGEDSALNYKNISAEGGQSNAGDSTLGGQQKNGSPNNNNNNRNGDGIYPIVTDFPLHVKSDVDFEEDPMPFDFTSPNDNNYHHHNNNNNNPQRDSRSSYSPRTFSSEFDSGTGLQHKQWQKPRRGRDVQADVGFFQIENTHPVPTPSGSVMGTAMAMRPGSPLQYQPQFQHPYRSMHGPPFFPVFDHVPMQSFPQPFFNNNNHNNLGYNDNNYYHHNNNNFYNNNNNNNNGSGNYGLPYYSPSMNIHNNTLNNSLQSSTTKIIPNSTWFERSEPQSRRSPSPRRYVRQNTLKLAAETLGISPRRPGPDLDASTPPTLMDIETALLNPQQQDPQQLQQLVSMKAPVSPSNNTQNVPFVVSPNLSPINKSEAKNRRSLGSTFDQPQMELNSMPSPSRRQYINNNNRTSLDRSRDSSGANFDNNNNMASRRNVVMVANPRKLSNPPPPPPPFPPPPLAPISNYVDPSDIPRPPPYPPPSMQLFSQYSNSPNVFPVEHNNTVIMGTLC